MQPARDGFVNAIQQYPFAEGALYQLYAAPGEVTDIALEPGEQLAGTGPVAAGDTARWIIGDTTSGTGALANILVKPVRPDIATNLVINTDRRTHHLELKATPARRNDMGTLKLGAIVEDKPLRITVELPAAVHRDLAAYAAAHGAEHGRPSQAVEKLVSPMLAAFMAGDRAFVRGRRRARDVAA